MMIREESKNLETGKHLKFYYEFIKIYRISNEYFFVEGQERNLCKVLSVKIEALLIQRQRLQTQIYF